MSSDWRAEEVDALRKLYADLRWSDEKHGYRGRNDAVSVEAWLEDDYPRTVIRVRARRGLDGEVLYEERSRLWERSEVGEGWAIGAGSVAGVILTNVEEETMTLALFPRDHTPSQ